MTCIACGSSGHTFFTQKGEYRIYRCVSCGHASVFPLPQNLSLIYGEDYFAGAKQGFGYVDYDGDKEPMRLFFTKELERAEKSLGGDSRILFDVGAATGFFLDIARARGWSASGVEISDFAAQQARDKGLEVITGTLQGLPAVPEHFDLVSMWDVIEHVQDPTEELALVHTLLKPGGLLLMTTPNFSSGYAKLLGARWHAIVPPEHLHYFTFKSMGLVLRAAGFEVISISAPIKSFTLEYIVQMLARWQGLGLWHRAAAFLKQHRKLAMIPLPIPLRDNMLIFARKK